MTFQGSEIAVGRIVLNWIGPLVGVLAALGGLVTVYARIEAEIAVQDERLRTLEAHSTALTFDHDLLMRIDVRLSNIERALTKP